MSQSIRFTRTPDGVKLAWALAGDGPALIKASNWLSHLEYDWDSPVWRHWIHFFADHFSFIRYDERGCGMSDWHVDDLSFPRWIEDFDTIVEASQPAKPFVLLGVSQGGAAAVSYAARHPENVSKLILYGTYARGWAGREDEEEAQRYQAVMQLTRIGWGQDNPVYRQLFTSRFVPRATPEQLSWFNELCRRTTQPEIAVRLMQARGQVAIDELLPQVSVPTLVVHAREDQVVPFSQGRLIASAIPGAEFVQLESQNHILLEHEPAWERFKDEVLAFTGRPAASGKEDPIFATLSPREREILVRIAQGCTNVQIGEQLFISEKTVRNHITRIFEKLGVSTRAQAIVLAKDKNLAA
ncbi:MAG TPA: alpha/beta fold hydrolase [Woeseiaceae bacterium]|nr:alpha/beta fold hydrolase [Woeseiaceae bacterium]